LRRACYGKLCLQCASSFPQLCSTSGTEHLAGNSNGRPRQEDIARANARESEIRAGVEHCFAKQKGTMGLVIPYSTPVSIDYRQIGFCDTYMTPGGVRASKPNEVYIVYKIDAVDNTKRDAEFNFVPYRLYVDKAEWGGSQTPWKTKPFEMQDWFARRDRRHFISNDTIFAQAVGVRAVVPRIIPHTAKTDIGGYSIVTVAFSDENEKAQAGQTFYKLAYDRLEGDGDSIPADPPITLNNTNAAQTTWPHPANCQELTLDKLAS
jgi:hypothetical protein